MDSNSSSKNIVVIIIVLVIVLVGGYFLLSGNGGGTGKETETKTSPKVELAPALQLTPQEKTGDVSEKKAEILSLVRSGSPLTEEQKIEIGGIMLAKSQIYNFTEAEREDIFAALSNK